MCWDLDNTLVDSGALIHGGMPLEQAVIEAEPITNMLEFYEVIRARLPDAHHFILSARTSSMRSDTLDWLGQYGLVPEDGAVCFLPYANAKPKVWRQLARDARLVIVDDLSYNHESRQASIYHDLVQCAQRTAVVYVGLDEIALIASDSQAIEPVASGIVESLCGPVGRS